MNNFKDIMSVFFNVEANSEMFTHHLKERMSQRNISETQLDLLMQLGEWNSKGDRLVLDHRNYDDLRDLITALKMELSTVEAEMKSIKKSIKKSLNKSLNKSNVTIYSLMVSMEVQLPMVQPSTDEVNFLKDKYSNTKHLYKKIKTAIKDGNKLLKRERVVLVTENGVLITAF